MRIHFFVTFLGFLACSRREDPSWAKLPTNAISGDTSITVNPAKIGRFANVPTMDGKLDESVWTDAVVLGPFVDPGEGGLDNGKLAGSFAKAGYDDHALYLGFVVRDIAPVAPFEKSEVDPHLWEKSSAVEVMLQPGNFPDNRDYYEMQFDTKNATFDTHWEDYNIPIKNAAEGKIFGHQEWSSQADRASVVEADRFYTVEVAIPWTSLVVGRTPIPPKVGDVWRMNLYAFRDSQGVANAWSPIKRQGNFHKSARFGRIQFN